MFNRVVSIFVMAVVLGMGTCAEVVPLDLGSIRVNTPMYTAEGIDNLVSNVVAGIERDNITDGTNTIDAAGGVYVKRGVGDDWTLVSGKYHTNTPVWITKEDKEKAVEKTGWYGYGLDVGYQLLSEDFYSMEITGVVKGRWYDSESGDMVERVSTNTWRRTNTGFQLIGRLALTNDVQKAFQLSTNAANNLITSATNELSMAVNLKADKATTLAGYGITDALPLVEDVNGEKTAVTIGRRSGTVGPYSLANGNNVTASGQGSHSEGLETVASGVYSRADGMFTEALGPGSYALGYMTKALPSHRHAFVWSGIGYSTKEYQSNGEGTFNINPINGVYGFYIGDKTLSETISDGVAGKADTTNVYTRVEVDAKVDAVDTKADEAYSAAEQMVDAVNSLASTIGTHTRNTNNPHNVTAAQVGAYTKAEVDEQVSNIVEAATNDLGIAVNRATSQMWIDTSTTPATTNFNQNFVPLFNKGAGNPLTAHPGDGYYGDEDGHSRIYNTGYGILLKDYSKSSYPQKDTSPDKQYGASLGPESITWVGASGMKYEFDVWSAATSGDYYVQKSGTYLPWTDIIYGVNPLPFIEKPNIVDGKITNELRYIKTPVSSMAVYHGLRAQTLNGHRLYDENYNPDGGGTYNTTLVGTDIPQNTNENVVSVGTRLANILDDRVVVPSNSWRQVDGSCIMNPIPFNNLGNDSILWGNLNVSRYVLLYQNSVYHYLTQMPEADPSEHSVATFAGTVNSQEIDFGEYGKFRRTPLNENETIHSIYSDQLPVILDVYSTNIMETTLAKVTRIYTEDGSTFLNATGVLSKITTSSKTLIMSNAIDVVGYTVTFTNIPNAKIPAFHVENASGQYEMAVRISFSLLAWSRAQSKWLGFSEDDSLSKIISMYGEDLSGAMSEFTSRNTTSPNTTEFEFGTTDGYWPAYIAVGSTETTIVNKVVFSKGDAKIDGSLSVGHESSNAANLYAFASGTNAIAVGIASHAEGDRTYALGTASHAEGIATKALGVGSHSSGINTLAALRATFAAGANASGTNSLCFIWNGNETSPWYGSHGMGTFNIKPYGGVLGFYIGEQNLLELLSAAITSNGCYEGDCVYDGQDESSMSVVHTNTPSLRKAVEEVAVESVLKPSDPLCGWSLPEYVSALSKYVYDEKEQCCYRREATNSYIILVAVTNIDLTAVGNIAALKAYEDSIAIRKPPKVSVCYTIGYEQEDNKFRIDGTDFMLEGEYLKDASVTVSYEVSGETTTVAIQPSLINASSDSIRIAAQALTNARSATLGSTIMFTIQTAYGLTTASATVANTSE